MAKQRNELADILANVLQLVFELPPGSIEPAIDAWLAKLDEARSVIASLKTEPLSKIVERLQSILAPVKPVAGKAAPGVKKGLSPERLAFLRVQGRYFGLFRHLTGHRTRQRIRRLAKAKGFPAAIAEMERVRRNFRVGRKA